MDEEKKDLEKTSDDLNQPQESNLDHIGKFLAGIVNETYNLPYEIKFDENKKNLYFENISD